jgi:hypothetical protein
MVRSVEFRGNGDIVIGGEKQHDVISSGVVLLTKEQAEQAERHGWRIGAKFTEATVPPLYRVWR